MPSVRPLIRSWYGPGGHTVISQRRGAVNIPSENVTHHIEEEEDEWFPQVRAGLSQADLIIVC
jgi:hypothetical protein